MNKRKTQYLLFERKSIYGIDFSGAVNAGSKIWITHGTNAEGTMRIIDCRRADDFLRTEINRDICLGALREFIRKEKKGVFGLDFPFGLPGILVQEKSWKEFAQSFPKKYHSAESFKNMCHTHSNGSEAKRITDKESKTPFSPYNLRLYRQTYFGIHDILSPLISDNSACALPMQHAIKNKPWLIEICPASTLKKLRLYSPYKGKLDMHRQSRKHICSWMKKQDSIVMGTKTINTAVNDHNGDAIDSIIAAFATFHTLYGGVIAKKTRNELYAIEGYVYI